MLVRWARVRAGTPVLSRSYMICSVALHQRCVNVASFLMQMRPLLPGSNNGLTSESAAAVGTALAATTSLTSLNIGCAASSPGSGWAPVGLGVD